jgi:flavodoxin
MPTAIIYHSETGNTRRVAEFLSQETGADLIAVEDRMHYGPVTRRLIGGRRALFRQRDRTSPAAIDVSAYDLFVIGTPVWARHPTPAITAVIDNLAGADGKDAVIFATCCLSSIHARRILEQMLEEKGVTVQGSVGFSKSERESHQKKEYLVKTVERFSTASPA